MIKSLAKANLKAMYPCVLHGDLQILWQGITVTNFIFNKVY